MVTKGATTSRSLIKPVGHGNHLALHQKVPRLAPTLALDCIGHLLACIRELPWIAVTSTVPCNELCLGLQSETPCLEGEASEGPLNWSSRILGQNKRAVLSDIVLPIIMACNPMAKIALDFRERLNAIEPADAADVMVLTEGC